MAQKYNKSSRNVAFHIAPIKIVKESDDFDEKGQLKESFNKKATFHLTLILNINTKRFF